MLDLPTKYRGYNNSETRLHAVREWLCQKIPFRHFGLERGIMPPLAEFVVISAALDRVNNDEVALKNIFNFTIGFLIMGFFRQLLRGNDVP